MNAVNRSIALRTAHKLRSAAEALWADASNQCGPFRDALQIEADAIQKRADSIEEQVKPTVPEPDQFGSIVRATCGPGLVGILWQHSPMQGKHYWESETGAVEVWPELTDVEVLRIGVGEADDGAALPVRRDGGTVPAAAPSSLAREIHHDHVSLEKVLDVLQEVRGACITAAEREAVQRCVRALIVLPTYARCEP